MISKFWWPTFWWVKPDKEGSSASDSETCLLSSCETPFFLGTFSSTVRIDVWTEIIITLLVMNTISQIHFCRNPLSLPVPLFPFVLLFVRLFVRSFVSVRLSGCLPSSMKEEGPLTRITDVGRRVLST